MIATDTDTHFEALRSDAEAFGQRLVQQLNDAASVVLTALGHRLGLFDALADRNGATAAALAADTGTNERYVREWLSGMTTAGIVEYSPADGTWSLPPAHATCLTRAAAPDNLAVTAQFVPLFGAVFERVVECFRTGGGLSYDECPGFHALMAEDSGQTVGAALFDDILPLVPGLSERLERGIDVLDAGCGRGRALLQLAEAFPRSRFTGIDLCADALADGIESANRRGLDNVAFVQRDLRGYRAPGCYDLVTTFDAVHDQPDPAGLLETIAEALRPGGVYLMQDIDGASDLAGNLDHPFGTFLYTISTLHCTPVSIGQGGPGLGTLWGREAAEAMLRAAGFDRVEFHSLAHDPVNYYAVARTS